MKYLERRGIFLELKKIDLVEDQKIKLFKNSEMISETFENDIPWGDSLIGRLINSTIRKGKIMVNAARIGRIPPQVENALNEMLANVVFTPEQKKDVIVVKIQMILEAIMKVVKGNDTIKQKLAALLGAKGVKGLIDLALDDIEEVEEFEGKDELLKKLKDFKEALLSKRDELEGEGETSGDDDEGEEETEDTSPDDTPPAGQPGNESTQDEVVERVKKILKSVLNIFNFFKIQPQEKQETSQNKGVKKWNGKEVIIISQDQEKISPGVDKQWNTKDDEFGKPPKKMPEGEVQIIIKNPITNKFDKDSEVRIVKPEEIKESFIYESSNEEVSKQIAAVKKKIGIVYGKVKFENKEQSINKLIELLDSNNNDGIEIAKELMKEVVKYEKTTGGPIKFQDLIKLNESAENFATSEYRQLVEPLGSIAKVLLGFKDNMEFLGNLKDAKEPISSFIENYLKFRGQFSKSENEKENSQDETEGGQEPTDQTKQDEKGSSDNEKTGEKESVNRVPGTDQFKKYNYKILKGQTDKVKDKFWELEEEIFNDQIKKGGNTRTGEGTRKRLLNKAKELVGESKNYSIGRYDNYRMIFEDVAGEMDAIYQEWRVHFSAEDETKYAVNEQKARELQKVSEEGESKKLKIDMKNDSNYDRIMEIVRLFGKAYRMYATQCIPSGRSGGRVSIGTFNEYEYIGKGDGARGDWSDRENPGKGPWAAIKVFDKWQEGIMKILGNTKYRTILANSEFTYGGEVPNKGAGKTLLKFMNDMITANGDSFNEAANKLIAEYFGGEVADKAKVELKPVDPGYNKIAKADEGKKGTVAFLKQETGFVPQDFKSTGDKKKTFCLLSVKVGGEQKKMVVYFDSIKKIGRNEYLLFKFHYGKSMKQSIISNYLQSEMKDKKLELEKEIEFVPAQPLYTGIYEIKSNSKFFKKSEKMEIKFIESKNVRREKSSKLEITLTDNPFLLAYLDEDKKGNQIQKLLNLTGDPTKLPSGDTSNLSGLLNNNDVQRNFDITT